MEKTTKKKKTKKGLKKRIGLIAIGGLSLVLTVCLSVGATLAWFAGSTHANKSLFMGGPVYVEMTGRDGSAADWQGGSGQLDIEAFKRGVGTIRDGAIIKDTDTDILLPGQGFAIYSQARVFSTSSTTSVGDKVTTNTSSGANTTNTSTGEHKDGTGRKTSATTSVLRARFSISVEFDPTVGFNNFTDTDYAENYPAQSTGYAGSGKAGTWQEALGAALLSADATNGRRDALPNTAEGDAGYVFASDATTEATLKLIKNGEKKSIYKWKFVSKEIYNNTNITAASTEVTAAQTTAQDAKFKYVQMGKPFDGTDTSSNQNGYYGVWVLDETTHMIAESDAFYKARCNAYLQSYVEHYPTEYGDYTTRTIANSLKALETALNESFVNLVNDSSNAIINGYLNGMTVDPDTGIMSYNPALTLEGEDATTRASWLYIDPTIGNDTNTNEIATGTGGWWYLVECDNGTVGGKTKDTDGSWISTDTNKIHTVTDVITGEDTPDALGNIVKSNKPTAGTDLSRLTTDGAKDTARLTAKLYEVKPTVEGRDVGTNGTSTIKKVVSYSFPFVNGRSVLEGDALTNIFANAKISVQISFQAIQAFFPFSTNIDNMNYKNTLLGTEKALNIGNAIPIYNEAFDYYENFNSTTVSGL